MANYTMLVPNLAALSLDTDGPKKTIQKNATPHPANTPQIRLPDVPPDSALSTELLKGPASKCLETYGVCLVRTQFAEPSALKEAKDGFWKMMRESPEFQRKPLEEFIQEEWIPSEGGFAALGNPSSFHHPFARTMREIAVYEAITNEVLPLRGRNVEKPFDRMMLRRVGRTPTAELVHRDIAANAQEGDDVFGGWINLNSRDQVFRCCPKTHLEVGGKNSGFVVVNKQPMLDHYKQQIRNVCIPAGYMMIFYERLVHEVAKSNTATDTTIRAHVGFRLTMHSEPLFGSEQTCSWVADQAVPRIKSGQVAPV
jgi:hypothetical protein